jgi:hypothetical protein
LAKLARAATKAGRSLHVPFVGSAHQ